jgi:hypothetical protein
MGDAEATELHARRVLEPAEELDVSWGRAWGRSLIGAAQLLRQEWEGAVEMLSEAVQLREQLGGSRRYDWLSWLARALLGAGQPERALELAEELAAAGAGNLFEFGMSADLCLAHVLTSIDAHGHADRIRQILDVAAHGVERLGVLQRAPLVCEERAFLARALGDDETWRHELSEAKRLHEQVGATGHAERLARELES